MNERKNVCAFGGEDTGKSREMKGQGSNNNGI